MFTNTDTLPWQLVADGTLVGVTWSRLVIRLPHAALGSTDVTFRIAGTSDIAFLPVSNRWDEPEITDVDEIAALALPLDDFAVRGTGISFWGPKGRLHLAYEALSIEVDGKPVENARELVIDHWADWRTHTAVAHPLVQSALREPWTPALIDELVATWRTERSSELAQVIEIVDRATRPAYSLAFRGADEVAAWTATWRDNPSAAIEALATRARQAHITPLEKELGTTDFDTYDAAAGRIIGAITQCLAAIDAAPDPRIGRCLEGLLASPSNHYFRIDQVSHAVTSFEKTSDEPSFADRLLPLLSLHADAGTAARLDEERRIVLIECDCNGAEMADSLRILIAELRLRYPEDRVLRSDIAQALRIGAL